MLRLMVAPDLSSMPDECMDAVMGEGEKSVRQVIYSRGGRIDELPS